MLSFPPPTFSYLSPWWWLKERQTMRTVRNSQPTLSSFALTAIQYQDQLILLVIIGLFPFLFEVRISYATETATSWLGIQLVSTDESNSKTTMCYSSIFLYCSSNGVKFDQTLTLFVGYTDRSTSTIWHMRCCCHRPLLHCHSIFFTLSKDSTPALWARETKKGYITHVCHRLFPNDCRSPRYCLRKLAFILWGKRHQSPDELFD